MKRKIPPFIFGVSIGLIISAAFFFFKLNEVFNRLKSTGAGQITVIEQSVKNEDVKDKKDKKKNKERFKINVSKSPNINYKEVDSLIALDSKISIATDELLSVKNVKVINIGDNITGRDSLAAKLAKVDNNYSNLYFIEFWKTPLNSKGYKFSKNKIMLYGFLDFNNVLLYQLDNAYYIKCSDQVYKLFYGGDFRKLEKVVDTDLLAKIN
ncbi:hypothetical protein [Aurantibacillus circumpalustris]|uniref:hypothetical protein n=1 Tax=Aurantibacillus circumpalustris TaxID=3036359 RepID=UPI00295A5CFA|nr:hypothetical protein [Aurantibacillus circumpalustris]